MAEKPTNVTDTTFIRDPERHSHIMVLVSEIVKLAEGKDIKRVTFQFGIPNENTFVYDPTLPGTRGQRVKVSPTNKGQDGQFVLGRIQSAFDQYDPNYKK